MTHLTVRGIGWISAGHLLPLASEVLHQDRVLINLLRLLRGHLLTLVLETNTVLLGFLVDRSDISLAHAVHLLQSCDLLLIFDA